MANPSKVSVALFAILIALFAGARVDAQSALDGFDPDAGLVYAIVVQPDGKVLIGGDFDRVQGVIRNLIARINRDGTLDATFNANAPYVQNATVLTIALQADGKILVGGGFNGANSMGGQIRNYIARLDPVTGAADSFNPNANRAVDKIVVRADGKILVGGAFTTIGGQTRNYIAQIDPITGLADSFNPSPTTGPSRKTNAIAVQADGKIVVGGAFNNMGGQPRNNIARLDPVTGLADSFNPDSGSEVTEIALQPDGKTLVGGVFGHIGGQQRNFIARLDPVTGLADSFNPNANNPIHAITLQPDGKILVGGGFAGQNSIGGQARWLARDSIPSPVWPTRSIQPWLRCSAVSHLTCAPLLCNRTARL
jgi:uncharacterized delta-60 repeat protein